MYALHPEVQNQHNIIAQDPQNRERVNTVIYSTVPNGAESEHNAWLSILHASDYEANQETSYVLLSLT